jgi:hypothetical protein
MARVGLKQAAELTGKSGSTIHRAAQAGRLSYSQNEAGERVFDLSELDRVFGLKSQGAQLTQSAPDTSRNDPEAAEIAALKARLEAAETRIRDLETDRDAWRDQAKQLARLPAPAGAGQGFWKRLFG